MNKFMYLLITVMLAATLRAADLETLYVDFGTGASPLESGYEVYSATHEQAATFTTQSYSIFGTTVSVTPTWAQGAVKEVMQMLDRGDMAYEDVKEDLLRDWIGSDTRSVGDPLTLTISGLPSGEYTWLSYHTDTGTSATVGTFDVTVTDAAGSVTTTDIQCSNDTATTIDSITTFETTIVSNGVDDITLVFDNQPYSNQYNQAWFVMNGFDLSKNFIRGAVTDPVPSGVSVDSQTTSALSWTAPVDPNLVSISGYDVVFGTEPNMLLNPVYSVNTESLPVTLDYQTTYYWRVDSHVVWDSADVTGVINDTVEGFGWTFTTLPNDIVPIVTTHDVLTSMELLPASLTGTVDDSGEGDIASIQWTVVADVPNAAKQMINRTGTGEQENLAEITSDPNLLQDWIGTDTREPGDPMVLTLKGLPADTYTWKSYHHDGQNQHGVFDVTIFDANGSATTSDIEITDANNVPATFEAALESNGTDDVLLFFDQQPYNGNVDLSFFVMNGFELTADTVGGSPLYIDFGKSDVPAALGGYDVYEALHEDGSSFTEQSYSAFGTTVSVLPTWGGYATVTDTTNDASSASQTATLDTDWPGEYTVTLSATDAASQTGSDTKVVTVAADNCAAAQLSPTWPGFNAYDYNEDCVVDIDDIAQFASEWLDDRKLIGQE